LKLFFLLPLLFLFTVLPPAFSAARVVGISDGDTITILHDNREQERIRFYGIDCPEKSQAFGQKAKQYASSLVYGKTVSIRVMDQDKYGRTVAWVYAGTINVNAELVRAGFAWHYRKYSKDSGLQRLEDEARLARRGLWVDPNPVPPWEYRKGTRISVATPGSITGGIVSLAQITNAVRPVPIQAVYHGNVKSRKFHRPGCSVYDCKNCTAVFRSREEAINAGYEPCQMCNP
jgi:endonuclease YncB( thermonuclease family)